MEICCKDCKHYWRASRDTRVSCNFITPIPEEDKQIPQSPSCELHNNNGVLMCQHLECFGIEESTTPSHGTIKEYVRIKGQAQLNEHNDCKYFKEKISFWTTFKHGFLKTFLGEVYKGKL